MSNESPKSHSLSIPSHMLPPGTSDAVVRLMEGPIGAAIAEAAAYSAASLAPATQRSYERDWAAFAAWCDAHDVPSLPAATSLVAGYIATRARTVGRGSLTRTLAAIAYRHRIHGHIWVPNHPTIVSVMRGILRQQARPVRPSAALTSDEVRILIDVCKCDGTPAAVLAGARDRALILLCLAGGLRRSELVALDVSDLRFTREGLTLRIRKSKGDQEGKGADVGICPGAHEDTCPVLAVRRWLRLSEITEGAIFRSLASHGKIRGRLTANGFWKVLRRRASQSGLRVHESERLSPHGFRAGFITEAYLNGALDEQVAYFVRQKDMKTTRGYRNRVKTISASPARLLNL